MDPAKNSRSTGESAYSSEFTNTLLKHLDKDVIERLALKPVTFEVMHEIDFRAVPSSIFSSSRKEWLL